MFPLLATSDANHTIAYTCANNINNMNNNISISANFAKIPVINSKNETSGTIKNNDNANSPNNTALPKSMFCNLVFVSLFTFNIIAASTSITAIVDIIDTVFEAIFSVNVGSAVFHLLYRNDNLPF